MISIIVASDPNGVIGKGNTIPWHLAEDLKLFKKRTLGSSVIMGRLTWDSLPKKPLIGRINYVVSKGPAHPTPHTCLAESLAGPIWCNSIESAFADADKNRDDEGRKRDIYVIGGEQIYKLALATDKVDQIILSQIHQTFDGDRYFKIPNGWVECSREKHSDFDVVHFVKG